MNTTHSADSTPSWAAAVARFLNPESGFERDLAAWFEQLALELELGNTAWALAKSQENVDPANPLCCTDPKDVATAPLVYSSQDQVLQFARCWQQEQDLAQQLYVLSSDVLASGADHHAKQGATFELSDAETTLTQTLNAEQLDAVRLALQSNFCMITGGPGTGKTFTLAKIVTLLKLRKPHLRIGLAAPTGKAAQRMQESLGSGLGFHVKPAMTVHGLIGKFSDSAPPKHHHDNPVPYDVVVVDEASMLGLELGVELISACRTSKLIFLGDSNQLASVEAGAVLHDLCASKRLASCHVKLTQSKRFESDSVVGRLAALCLKQDADKLRSTLDPNFNYQQLQNLKHAALVKDLADLYAPFFTCAKQSAGSPYEARHASEFFTELNKVRVLSATRQGEHGVEQLNHSVALHYAAAYQAGVAFHGMPLMITRNDSSLKLANGDVGVCHIDHKEVVRVLFEHRPPVLFDQLSPDAWELAFVMTVHKSQGSEFNHVVLVLSAPTANSQKLLSKQLVYTALTRAKTKVSLYESGSLLHTALSQTESRHTHLVEKLDRIKPD